MKKVFLLSILLSNTFLSLHAQYKGQKFTITVANAGIFDLYAEGHPLEGQGIFPSFFSLIKTGNSNTYTCANDNALKGVEGHLKFRAFDKEVAGWVDIYFNNPAVGSMKFSITADWPFTVKHVIPAAEKRYPNLWIEISADTVNHGSSGASGINGSMGNNPKQNYEEPIPAIINFDWQVTQRMHKDEEDDNNGKAYQIVTYFFTTNGDYAAVKPDDADFDLMIYSKHGQTWLFDDKKKTITVMNMPKTVGEGGMLGKQVAEKINKGPIAKDRDDETDLSVIKTGKTKNILGYTADEYQMRPKVIATKNAMPAISFWYAKVPFDPVRVYTMGTGRPADLSKIINNPKLKNSVFAIPLLNTNYLSVETEGGGLKALETTEIKKVNNTIYTAGYKIKQMNSLKDMFKNDTDN
jgi:hypothetical protein